jgi:hypothetical protein
MPDPAMPAPLETPHRIGTMAFATPIDSAGLNQQFRDGVQLVEALGREGATERLAAQLQQLFASLDELSAALRHDVAGVVVDLPVMVPAGAAGPPAMGNVDRVHVDVSLASGTLEAVLEGPGTRVAWRDGSWWLMPQW